MTENREQPLPLPRNPFEQQMDVVPATIQDRIRGLIKRPFKGLEDRKHPNGESYSLEDQIKASADQLIIFVGSEIWVGNEPEDAYNTMMQAHKSFLASQESGEDPNSQLP